MQRLSFLVLAVVLLAACGGSGRMSKTAYQQTTADRRQGVAAGRGRAHRLDERHVARAARDESGRGRGVGEEGRRRPRPVKAPKDAEADNTAIVAALRAIQTGLENVKKTAASGDAGAVQKAAASIETLPQLKAAEKAVGDLKAKGYKVGVLGS